MRTAITLVLILAVAGVAGGYALGRLISADHLRAQVIDQAQATSGREVLIDGGLDIEFLPRPTVSLQATRFLGARPDDEPVLEVERIDLAVAPLALLRGKVEVTGVHLVRPRLRLAWPADRPVGLLELLGGQVMIDLPDGLDRLSVIDGVVGIAGTGAQVMERVDMDLEAEGRRGPFFVDSTFVHAGERFVLDGRLGRLTADPNTTLTFSLASNPDAALAMQLDFQGIVALDRLSSFRGQASFAGASLDAALAVFGPDLDAGSGTTLDVPFAFEGVVESDDGAGVLSELNARLGGIRGSGRLEFDLGDVKRIDLVLDIPQIEVAPRDIELAALEPVASVAALVQGEIDLSVETLMLDDAAVRDVRLTLDLQAGSPALVRTARAVLPGDTDVVLSGWIGGANGAALNGRVGVVTDRFGDLLAWLVPDLTGEASARLRTLSAEAELAVAPDRIALKAIDGRLDVSRVAGEVAVMLGDQPRVRADLAIDRLHLDRYLPDLAADAAVAMDGALRSTDIALELRLERLTASGLRSSDVLVLARAEGGRLELEELSGRFSAETSLRVSGSVDVAREVADLSLALASARPGPLVRRLGAAPAFSLERLGELEVDATLRGWTGGATLEGTARLDQLRSDASGRVVLDEEGALTLDLDVELVHPHYADLLANIGLGDPTIDGEPLTGTFKIRRRPAGEAEVVGNLRLGESRITGQVEYLPRAPGAHIDGRLSVADPRLETLLPLLALGGYRIDSIALLRPLPGPWPELYLDARPLRALTGRLEVSGRNRSNEAGFEALVTSEDGMLRLERGAIRFDDAGEVALEALLDVRGGAPALALALEAAGVQVDRLPWGLAASAPLSGRLDLYGEISATGYSLEDLVRSSEGDVALAVRDGEVALPVPAASGAIEAPIVPLDLLDAHFDVRRGLAEVNRLDLETADGLFRGQGLIDFLIWMVDLDLVEQGDGRRIELVGPPDDVHVLVREPDAHAPAE